MDRVFLDANILFSAAFRAGAKMLRLWKLDGVELVTSAYAVEEARRNLDTEEQRERLDALLVDMSILDEPTPDRPMPAGVTLPVDDRPILLASVAAGATHLLTGNHRDFGPYYGRRIEGVLILLPAHYPPVSGNEGRVTDLG